MKLGKGSHFTSLKLNDRGLCIVTHALFSGWMLSFLFEGRILYSLMDQYNVPSNLLVFGGMIGQTVGLVVSGFVIQTLKMARCTYLFSFPVFVVFSGVFFLPPSFMWLVAMMINSALAGACVASWGFFLQYSTPRLERIKTVADMLILSNVFMTLLNLLAVQGTPQLALAAALVMLLGAFGLALRLPHSEKPNSAPVLGVKRAESFNPWRVLAFLCLFILAIAINSGLMYEVVVPAFSYLETTIGWLWALPYILGVLAVRSSLEKTDRTFFLYGALAMLGLSFIGFMVFGRGLLNYYVVTILMMGALGIYDLYWWATLADMLEFGRNPAQFLGFGLAANVFGIFIGGVVGRLIHTTDVGIPGAATLLALTVVCITLALLPALHKYLTQHLVEQVDVSVLPPQDVTGQEKVTGLAADLSGFTEREREVVVGLLQRKSYRMIAQELFISENTVKYHVKNIYSKMSVQSRDELIALLETKHA